MHWATKVLKLPETRHRITEFVSWINAMCMLSSLFQTNPMHFDYQVFFVLSIVSVSHQGREIRRAREERERERKSEMEKRKAQNFQALFMINMNVFHVQHNTRLCMSLFIFPVFIVVSPARQCWLLKHIFLAYVSPAYVCLEICIVYISCSKTEKTKKKKKTHNNDEMLWFGRVLPVSMFR